MEEEAAPVVQPEIVEGTEYEDREWKEEGEEGEITEEQTSEESNLILDEEKELTDEERVQLYEKAMKFKAKNSHKHALLCFLGCIKGIQQNSRFSLLPNCLQNIASIYAKFEDFPKAVQFMQAAKLYYETALIGTQLDEDGESYKTMDENAVQADAKRANEYEKLSHDCLMEKSVQLALEYCGKSTQLRRKVYGENHPVTVKSLDLFTMIYAEMGKMQYSDAVKKLDSQGEEGQEEQNATKKVRFEDEVKSRDDAPGENTSKAEKESDEEEDKKMAMETTEGGEDDEGDAGKTTSSKFISSKQMIFIFLISSLVAVFVTFTFCAYSENEACPSYDYILERVKFYYYFYVKSFFTENNYV